MISREIFINYSHTKKFMQSYKNCYSLLKFLLILVYLSVGLTSSGYAQANLPLKPNTTYFTTLRGVTNDGNVLQTSSDGFTIDQSAPIIAIDRSDYQFYLKKMRYFYFKDQKCID